MASYIGPNVFVTGASRGIGLGIVRHLVKVADVQKIFAGARTPNEANDLQELAKQNPKIQIVQFDSLDDNSIKSAVKEVENKTGNEGLNLLINNAGVFLSDGNNSLNPEREAVLKVYNTNVVGIQISIPLFLPLLKKATSADKPAKILNISSGAGSTSGLKGAAFPHSNATYPASKAALNSYTKFVATSEYGKDLIVIAMCPGWVQTDMGGQSAHLTVDESVSAILETISNVKQADTGSFPKMAFNVFITGANRGIGFGFVKHLLLNKSFKTVFAGTRSLDRAQDLKELSKADDRLKIIQIDVTSDQSIEKAVEAVKSSVGDVGLNWLINNSGVFSDSSQPASPNRQKILEAFNVNTVGAIVTQAKFFPLLKKAATLKVPSRIINMSSIAGSLEHLPDQQFWMKNSTYAMTKSALNAHTRYTAFSSLCESNDIIVVACHPGWIKTHDASAELSVDDAVSSMIATFCRLKRKHSGSFIDNKGDLLPN
ncbi:hypothetical protein M3Y97_00782000 [Aphelenchoides bicaudatus]|nr:hypothetical protein M3Y97_00782000 [Aphelenchoides bicaudatus]